VKTLARPEEWFCVEQCRIAAASCRHHRRVVSNQVHAMDRRVKSTINQSINQSINRDCTHAIDRLVGWSVVVAICSGGAPTTVAYKNQQRVRIQRFLLYDSLDHCNWCIARNCPSIRASISLSVVHDNRAGRSTYALHAGDSHQCHQSPRMQSAEYHSGHSDEQHSMK
jgi:hypothetical protein